MSKLGFFQKSFIAKIDSIFCWGHHEKKLKLKVSFLLVRFRCFKSCCFHCFKLKPRYNETPLCQTIFFGPFRVRYIRVLLYYIYIPYSKTFSQKVFITYFLWLKTLILFIHFVVQKI